MKKRLAIFWFRRDLRLHDNIGLYHALNSGFKVLPLFIFDEDITQNLERNDARISFIYESLKEINDTLGQLGSSLCIRKGKPLEVWKELIEQFEIKELYLNHDYEPYAMQRDDEITKFLQAKNVLVYSCKDQVIFEKEDILKKDGKPYTVFTPYKNQWLKKFDEETNCVFYDSLSMLSNVLSEKFKFPSLQELGFQKSGIRVKPYRLDTLGNYDEGRDFPSRAETSNLSPYLRFGLVSIRKMVREALHINMTFLSELIWREFFMQILYHFPRVTTQNFKPKYDRIIWRNNEDDFARWCRGETGYPLVDAGMRELNKTGYMHNRVRMITAGFLCKHLLIDWRWGERYFASKLLDYELSSNNGNWQWAAGTGCDAAPYFRVFNPAEQLKKFDKQMVYTKKWIENFDDLSYPVPMVDHKMARERAIQTYKDALT